MTATATSTTPSASDGARQQRQAHLGGLARRLRALANEAAAAAESGAGADGPGPALSAICAQLRALAEHQQQQHQQQQQPQQQPTPDGSDVAARQRLERLVQGGAAGGAEGEAAAAAAAAGEEDARAERARSQEERQQRHESPAQPPPREQQTRKKEGKGARAYDARKYGARRVLLEVAYVGGRYRGFARQTPGEAKRAAAAEAAAAAAAAGEGEGEGEGGRAAGPSGASRAATAASLGAANDGDDDGTVEGALFSALRRVCLAPPGADPARALGYSRCGRTDRGVSALGQVVALSLRSRGPAAAAAAAAVAAAAGGEEGDEAEAEAAAAAAAAAAAWQPRTALGAATAPLALTPRHLLPPPEEEIDYAAALNRALPPDVRVLGWADPPEMLLPRPHAPAPAGAAAGAAAAAAEPAPKEEQEEAHDAPAAPAALAPPVEFDARFSASYREYLYFFASPYVPGAGALDRGSSTGAAAASRGGNAGARASAGAAAAAVGAAAPLDVAAMDEAARHLVGEHDFRSFCKLDASGHVKHFVRRVISARVLPAGAAYAPAFAGAASGASPAQPRQQQAVQTFALRIRGTAFLYHQVRCVAAVLLMVGRGLERPDVVRRLLDSRAHPRKPQYALAPEQPLLLYACGYGGDAGDDDDDDDGGGGDEGQGRRGAAAAAAAAAAAGGAPHPARAAAAACGKIRWHRSARAVQAAEASLGALLQSHLVGAAMAGAMLERVRRNAARAGHPAPAADAGGGGGGDDNADNAARRQHVPLLERSTEPSLDERFRALGIPTDGLAPLQQREREGGATDPKRR